MLGAAERERLRRPAAHAAHEEHPDPDHDRERDDPAEEEIFPERRLDLAGELHAVLLELAHERLLIDARNARHAEDADVVVGAQHLAQTVAGGTRRGREGARFREAADLALGERDLLDLVGAQQVEELRHREVNGAGSEEP